MRRMAETTLEVRVPSELLQFGIDQVEIQRRVNEWLVISLFSEGQISSGKAARFLGLSRIDFLSILQRHGVAYVNYTPEELTEELAAADSLKVTPGS
jgi:predicted HTH domain antitoxin